MTMSAVKDAFYIFSVVTMTGLLGMFVWFENYKTEMKTLRVIDLENNLTSSTFLKSYEVDFPPVIYVITPTYTRLVQKVELTRVSMVLKAVPNIHWLVIEDSPKKTALVSTHLKNSGLKYTHLTAATPQRHRPKDRSIKSIRSKHRGVSQRNAGLRWLKKHLNPNTDEGVVYFADDDNTYTTELFEDIRSTKKVSVFPVGLIGGLRYQSPIIKKGKVVGWYTAWKKNERRFALDMAAFAVNIKLILTNPKAYFSFDAPLGFLETKFLETLHIGLNDLEPKASMCTKVLVWHTRTVNPGTGSERKMRKLYNERSNPNIEV